MCYVYVNFVSVYSFMEYITQTGKYQARYADSARDAFVT